MEPIRHLNFMREKGSKRGLLVSDIPTAILGESASVRKSKFPGVVGLYFYLILHIQVVTGQLIVTQQVSNHLHNQSVVFPFPKRQRGAVSQACKRW